MTLTTVLFDFDDTLCPEMSTERDALLAACELAARRYRLDAETLADALSDEAGRLWGSWGMADYYRNIGYSRWEGLWGPFDIPDVGLEKLDA